MPQFFFHVINDGAVVPDYEGDDFPDLETAKAEAAASAKDAARQYISDGGSLKDAWIQIRDDKGRLLAAVGLH